MPRPTLDQKQRLGEAWEEWNRIAAIEAADLFGHDGPLAQPFALRTVRIPSMVPNAKADKPMPSRAYAWLRRRMKEVAASIRKGTMGASTVLGQIVKAKDNMLKKQLGDAVAAGAALLASHLLEAIGRVDCGLCDTWADFFGEQEKKVHMGEWKQKEQDWSAFLKSSMLRGPASPTNWRRRCTPRGSRW